ncbi:MULTISPECIES: hypothetical protein [unclassified Bacillus (in: firmicutes)]|uniref:hypothetical protein n=1 Tax=unclassified Bacillus (in: firmicutes) TaxID=185979 RepID=UPI00300FE2D1|nr:hypothetical protein [Bacillus paranthracis]
MKNKIYLSIEDRECLGIWWISNLNIIDTDTAHIEYFVLGVDNERFLKVVRRNFLQRIMRIEISTLLDKELSLLKESLIHWEKECQRVKENVEFSSD